MPLLLLGGKRVKLVHTNTIDSLSILDSEALAGWLVRLVKLLLVVTPGRIFHGPVAANEREEQTALKDS
jgi:hypothetical protein